MYEKMKNAALWNLKDEPLEKQWSSKNTYEEIVARAEETPNKPAITFQIKSGEKDKAETLNWEQMRARVAQCANALHAMGIGENDVVAYVMPNCNEAVIINQGAMTAGIVNPVNPLISPEHIGGILAETGAKIVVTLAAFPKAEIAQTVIEALKYAPNVKTVLTVDLARYLSPPLKWLIPLLRPKVTWPANLEVRDFNAVLDEQPTELNFEHSGEDRVCAYFHTGGTTGRPKVAQHKYSGALYNGWLGKTLLASGDDVFICPLPLFHVLAAYPVLMTCLMSGAHLVMVTPAGYRGEGVFDNFWKLVERYKVSSMVMVPTAAAQLMQREIKNDVSSLRVALCGSSPLPVGLYNRFEESTGVKIVEGYGMTEVTCMISINPMEDSPKVGSVGYPMPYNDVKIFDCDANGDVKNECKIDEIGEICVNNPGVFVGNTYTEVDQNKTLFANEKYLRTGDLGRIDSEGYLWITGRAKDLIIRGGHNIDPAMIEDALAEHPDVAFVGAVGQPDAYSGELPCAYVELVAGSTATVEALTAYAKENIAESAAMPKYIEIMPELPKTAVGKVFKPDLRRKAITRVLDQNCGQYGVKVAEVTEDKKRGLVAHFDKVGACDEKGLAEAMGKYSVKWQLK